MKVPRVVNPEVRALGAAALEAASQAAMAPVAMVLSVTVREALDLGAAPAVPVLAVTVREALDRVVDQVASPEAGVLALTVVDRAATVLVVDQVV